MWGTLVAVPYNGGQKNLGLCEKSPSKQLLRGTLLLRAIFWFGFAFIPSFPYSPLQCCGQKSTHSLTHPFCSKFNFVWGGRGGVASFSNITGKVPTLLTSIVGSKIGHHGAVRRKRREATMLTRGHCHLEEEKDTTIKLSKRLSLNRFSPSSDPHPISPNNNTAWSNIQVMRMKKCITKDEMLWY